MDKAIECSRCEIYINSSVVITYSNVNSGLYNTREIKVIDIEDDQYNKPTISNK